MEEYTLLYCNLKKNVVITVFQNDWLPLRSCVLSFVCLKTLFKLPREGGRDWACEIKKEVRRLKCFAFIF